MKLDMKLAECFRELNAGDWNEAHVALYAKYFDMNVETVDGVEKKTYSYKEKALEDAESHYAGYLAIVTDQVDLTSREVLEIYRSRSGGSHQPRGSGDLQVQGCCGKGIL